MGKGDKKSRRGKIFQGSFGRLRPRPQKGNKTSITNKENSPEKGK